MTRKEIGYTKLMREVVEDWNKNDASIYLPLNGQTSMRYASMETMLDKKGVYIYPKPSGRGLEN